MIAARLANLPRGRRETNGSIDLFTTQQQAASLLNVSTPSVERARVVLSEGTPEMIAAVDAGSGWRERDARGDSRRRWRGPGYRHAMDAR